MAGDATADGALRVTREQADHERYFAVFAATFAVVLVLTNIVGLKLFELFPGGRPAIFPGEGPLTLTSGIITYPLTFLITDLVSEIWGRRRASFMVWLGFALSLLMLAILEIAKPLPISPHWANPDLGLGARELDAAFDATFYFPGLLLFASMTAYLAAQLFDVRLYHFWWNVTKGGHMWIRNNGSTAISQLVDTIIVNAIYLRFGLHMEWATIGSVIGAVYLCKLALAVCDTPLIYAGRWFLRRRFGLESAGVPRHAPLA